MRERAFKIGVVIMGLGAMAMDSEGIGWMIAAAMVFIGAAIAHVAYAMDRLEKERQETERRIQKLRKSA